MTTHLKLQLRLIITTAPDISLRRHLSSLSIHNPSITQCSWSYQPPPMLLITNDLLFAHIQTAKRKTRILKKTFLELLYAFWCPRLISWVLHTSYGSPCIKVCWIYELFKCQFSWNKSVWRSTLEYHSGKSMFRCMYIPCSMFTTTTSTNRLNTLERTCSDASSREVFTLNGTRVSVDVFLTYVQSGPDSVWCDCWNTYD